jgi:hypothetical protein
MENPAEPPAYRDQITSRPVQEQVWLGERDCFHAAPPQRSSRKGRRGIPRKLMRAHRRALCNGSQVWLLWRGHFLEFTL